MVNNVDVEAPLFTFVPRTSPCLRRSPAVPRFLEALDACSPVIYAASDTVVEHPTVGVYQVIENLKCPTSTATSQTRCKPSRSWTTCSPVFTFVPPGDTVVCDAPPVLVQAEAVDNCGDVTMVFSEEIAEEDALGNQTLVRRFEAFDLAGNSTVATQVVRLENYVAPGIWSCARRRHLDVRPTVAGRIARVSSPDAGLGNCL